MRMLVTGGAGFIGSHVVDRLVKLGHEVVVLDNLLTGSKDNINPKAIFYELDITDLGALEKIFKEYNLDYVFHLAAGYLVQSLENPQRDAAINIIGTINLCELCVKYNIKKIIYSNSGGASYGEPEKMPITETHSIHPLTPYGASKYTGEMYLYLYNKSYGLNYTSLRYANIYGPRQNPKLEGGVISIFVDKLLEDKPPTIFGDGTITRDFCYVDDVVDANILAMEKGKPEGYNVGTGIETNIKNLFEVIKNAVNSNLEPIYGPPRQGDCKRSVFDISKIKKDLGWEPKTSIDKGIKKTINWVKEFQNNSQIN